jgi:hypothetical protein
MIKTLHITSIVIGILTVGIIVFGGVLGGHVDEEVEKFLQSPSAMEKFETAKDKRAFRRGVETSPLVKEAKAYALYLNPPPKPQPKKRLASTKTSKKVKPKRPPAPVSAKFKLIGTAYYPLNPKSSMALIDQPGKGLSWVRQGNKVEHLIFEQIKDGVVVIRDGQKTREMKTPERAEDKAIKKFISSSPKGSIGATRKTLRRSPPVVSASPEELKAIEEVFSKVSADLQEGDQPDESAILMLDEVLSSISRTRMNDNEANDLRVLGETLEQAQEATGNDSNPEPDLVPDLVEPNIKPDLESDLNTNLGENLDIDSEYISEPNFFDPNFDPNLDPNL